MIGTESTTAPSRSCEALSATVSAGSCPGRGVSGQGTPPSPRSGGALGSLGSPSGQWEEHGVPKKLGEGSLREGTVTTDNA